MILHNLGCRTSLIIHILLTLKQQFTFIVVISAEKKEDLRFDKIFSMSVHQVRMVGLPLMNLVLLRGMPLLLRLHLEQRLLRTSSDNWCIINDGTNDRNIVIGVSG